ncbi:MAG: hypothetical protein HZA66_23005 [Rhodopseudomonas palustris]|uniref:Uncharacterized protein n=1 Tax=Rhodopseudomonas palustris TaxID=1076 RepID=A0A933W382_RHOPL|nr:hypothetical protein [Rhodopseudomonas palustris]
MKKLIIATTVLTLAGGAFAFAQSGSGGGSRAGGAGSGAGGLGGPANPSVPPALTPDQRVTGQAPVGHRQPRRSDGVDGDINQVDPADAALDRKIKSICRGC